MSLLVTGCDRSEGLNRAASVPQGPLMVKVDTPWGPVTGSRNDLYRRGLLDISEDDLKKLKKKAKQGDMQALSRVYLYYKFVEGQDQIAAPYLSIAGKGGIGIGQYNIIRYPEGYSTGGDGSHLAFHTQYVLPAELIPVLEPQAMQGNSDAAMRLAEHYYYGERNAYFFFRYITLAAKFGQPKAMRLLGNLYPDEVKRKKIIEEYCPALPPSVVVPSTLPEFDPQPEGWIHREL